MSSLNLFRQEAMDKNQNDETEEDLLQDSPLRYLYWLTLWIGVILTVIFIPLL